MSLIMLWRAASRTGLSSLRDRAAARLAGSGFNPSRRQRIIGVGSMLFLTGAGLGAQGHVAMSLFEFTLAGLCLWQLHREADDKR
jgi:hypothetical protein